MIGNDPNDENLWMKNCGRRGHELIKSDDVIDIPARRLVDGKVRPNPKESQRLSKGNNPVSRFVNSGNRRLLNLTRTPIFRGSSISRRYGRGSYQCAF